MKQLMVILCAVSVAVGLVAAFSGGGREGDPAKIEVAVSVAPQAYFVERVGGERVKVAVMIPPGRSPHGYEPAAAQMKELSEAKLYVKVGHPLFEFETARFDKLLAARDDLAVIDMSRGADVIAGDEHVWLSPVNAPMYARAIRDALAAIDPGSAEIYAENTGAFIRDIEELKKEIGKILEGVKNRKFLVYHASWGYFARDFNLEQVPIEAEGHRHAGARDIGKFIERANEEGIKVIFVQEQISSRQAEVIAREIGGSVRKLDPLAADWLENLKSAARAFREAME